MKTKLTTEQQTEIERIKLAIVDLSTQQDSLYAKLLLDLNIVDHDEDEAIFDYIFNNYINPSNNLWPQEK